MSAVHLLASSEALLAGRQFGLDPDVMLSIVNSSSGRSGSTQVKWPKFILPEAYDSGTWARTGAGFRSTRNVRTSTFAPGVLPLRWLTG